MTSKKQEFLDLAVKKFGQDAEFQNREMLEFAEALKGFEKADWNWVFNSAYKVSRGLYRLPAHAPGKGDVTATRMTGPVPPKASAPQTKVAMAIPGPKFDPNASSEYDHAAVPARDAHYVPFGEFKVVEQIVRSAQFFPIFIAGHSGNGKTFMVEQVCARSKRPMVRVQMSRETDEDDLIGGFRLIDGQTKFMKGPVLRAMEQGALLLIDEADRADPGKVMCIQGVLEGKPYYVKKTGEIIQPQPGFNVIVTANTKGKGSDDGRYAAAGILDDAWLERFPITIEQEYPPANVETRILTGYLMDGVDELTDPDKEFQKNLVNWADITRKAFAEGAIDEIISTRRLVHIVKTYRMFSDREKAIGLCINRFNQETKVAFMELYQKVDATLNQQESQGDKPTEDVPF